MCLDYASAIQVGTELFNDLGLKQHVIEMVGFHTT